MSRPTSQRGSMSLSAKASRSRASTTLSRSPRLIRSTASATAASHSGPLSAPSAKETLRGGSGGAGRLASGLSAVAGPIVVSQERPLRRPTTTRGTTSVDWAAVTDGSKVKLPNAMKPAPAGAWSSSAVTSRCATRSSSHSEASSRLLGLVPGHLAPADHAVAVPHPGVRVLRWQQGEQ